MKLKMIVSIWGIAVLASSLSACCTVMDGKSQPVAIKTNAPAMFSIHHDDGEQVAQGVAPTTVKLKRGDGPYQVTLQRTDSSPISQGTIDDNLNGWLWGNIFTPLGLVLDFVQGSAWDLDDSITVNTQQDIDNPNANALNTPHVATPIMAPIIINNTQNNGKA